MPGAVAAGAAAGADAGRAAAGAGLAAARGLVVAFFFAGGGGGAGSRAATTGLGLNWTLDTASGSPRGSPGINTLTGTVSGLKPARVKVTETSPLAGTESVQGVRQARPPAVRASAPGGSDSSRKPMGWDEDIAPVGNQSVGIHEAQPPRAMADAMMSNTLFMAQTPAVNSGPSAVHHLTIRGGLLPRNRDVAALLKLSLRGRVSSEAFRHEIPGQDLKNR
jgi:hypothetical protein